LLEGFDLRLSKRILKITNVRSSKMYMCKSLMTPVESMDAKPGIHEQQLRVSERKVMRKI